MKQSAWYPGQARRLQQAMRSAGLFPCQLSHLAQVQLLWIDRYLRGVCPLEEQGHAGPIAEALGVSTRWLITGEVSPAAQAVLAGFARYYGTRSIPLEMQAFIRQTIEMLPSAEEIEQRNQLKANSQ